MSARKQDLDQLMAAVRVRLPGHSDAGIKVELYSALKEFFNESSSWTEAVTMSSVEDVDTYTVTPSGGQIVRLAGVTGEDGLPLPAVIDSIGVLDATVRFRNAFTAVQLFTAYVVKTVALPKDNEDFPVMPDWLLPLWGEGIQDGVLGRMMSQPAKSYTNLTQAKYHLAKFLDAIQIANVATVRRHTFGTQAWQFPSFARGNQRGHSGGDRSFG